MQTAANKLVVQYTRTVTDREAVVSVRRVLYGPWNPDKARIEEFTVRKLHLISAT